MRGTHFYDMDILKVLMPEAPIEFSFFAEYMHGGSLYDYLHKQQNILELSLLLKFALDVCCGMEYLHQKNIIHRDLKTANLLMDDNQVRSPKLIPLVWALKFYFIFYACTRICLGYGY